MSNLLPEHNKKKLRQEYRRRLAVVVLIFVSTVSIMGLAFLVPTYVLLETEYADRFKKRDEVVSSIKASQGDNYIAALADTNAKISVLSQTTEASDLLGLTRKITNQIIPGVTLTSIDYISAQNGVSKLQLTGLASTRDTLIQFKNNIQKEKLFTSVTHSIEDLVKAENLTFTLNIVGTF